MYAMYLYSICLQFQ